MMHFKLIYFSVVERSVEHCKTSKFVLKIIHFYTDLEDEISLFSLNIHLGIFLNLGLILIACYKT